MKVLRLLLIAAIVTIGCCFPPIGLALSDDPITTKVTSVNNHPVSMICVNLSDPRVEVRPVLANGKTGQTTDLAAMARFSGATAAVNGTFFNAYSDMTSWGSLVIDGVVHRVGRSGGAIGITSDGRIRVARLRLQIKGSINEIEKWPNNWSAWDVNRNIADPQAVMIFTPSFGQAMREPTATTITVRQGRVVTIQCGPVTIPSDGYVIGCGPNARQIASRFAVGDSVQVRYIYADERGNTLDWSNVCHVIQGGPLLVRDGVDVLDIAADKFKEPKFYKKCSWSFVGVKYNNILVMGTVSGVNMAEMAQTVQKLGLKDAVSMDGNASCGLYCRSKYLIQPGRKLSNCLSVILHPPSHA